MSPIDVAPPVPQPPVEFVEIRGRYTTQFRRLPGASALVDMWRAKAGEEDEGDDATSLRDLSWQIVTMSFPVSVGNILMFSLQTMTASFVGRRMGSDVFAHYMIGVSVFNIFGLSIGSGLVAALDTLASQSFGRHKQNSSEIGEYLQRATLVNIILMIPLGLLFVFGKPIWMGVFGNEGGTGASVFTTHAVVYLFTSLMTSTLTRVLAAVNEPQLTLYVNSVVAVACFLLNYFFTNTEVVDAVYVLTATYAIYLALLLAMYFLHPRITFWRKCQWPSPKLLDREGMREYLSIGIPSLVSVIAEWWAFEVLQVIAANIGMRQVAELNIVMSVTIMLFSVSLGVSVAASVRIGNALGEKKPTLARRFALSSIVVDQLFNLFDVVVLVAFHRPIASVFTEEDSLKDEFGNLIPLVALHHWMDSTQFLFQGIFRGGGMQSQAVRAVVSSL